MEDKKKKHKKVMKSVKKCVGITVGTLTVAGAIGAGAMYMKYKPTIEKAQALAFTKEGSIDHNTFKRAGNSVVLDKDGNQIAKISGEEYSYVDISKVSPFVSQGYISIEDKDFLKHNGISIKGMARAGVEYIKNRKVTSGGSTITQQLIKNTLLTQDRTIDRKITEIFLAPKIEKLYTKTQIMEFYVNNCYYGEGCYGIESAAQHYFSKSASELTLSESAILCGVSNNPTMWSPTKNPENCLERRDLILDNMLADGYITQDQCDQAKKADLVLNIKDKEPVEENYMSSYAIDCAVRELMAQNGFEFEYVFKSRDEEKAYKERYKESYAQYDRLIRSGGYTIYTSIDMEKQKMLQESVDNGLAKFKDTDSATGKYLMQGAAVSIDNQTGYVVAIVGGRGETDMFNRGFLAYRQPGSSIKPIVAYTPYFEKGNHPLSIVKDKAIENGPKNDDFIYNGDVTVRYAVERSINTIPYNILSGLKASNGLKYLEKMKYSGLHPEDDNPIIALGGFTEGVTPVEQAGAYFTLANGGYYIQPSCVTKIVYMDNDTIYKNDRKGEKVYSAETSYMMTDVMRGVIEKEHATGYGLSVGDQWVAGKTGTTSDCKDGWFCGYSPYYTTVVWCGYDMPRSVSDLYGATYPGHIWQDYMLKVHEGLPAREFKQPSGIVWKNIDSQGNITSSNTGLTDMFSRDILTRLEDEAKEEQKRQAAEKQAAWRAQEPNRQANARDLLDKYLKMSYSTRDDIKKVDSFYNDLMVAISAVEDPDVSKELKDKAQAHHDAIIKLKEQLQDIMKKEEEQRAEELRLKAEREAEAKRQANEILANQQKEEARIEEEATEVVRELEKISESADRQEIVNRIKEATEKVANVTNKDKNSSLNNRIDRVKSRFGLA